jgi:repressor LexA
MALTRRQYEVLAFVRQFIQEQGFSPSYEEIANGLQISSLATVHKHLLSLEEKGLIRRAYNRSRSIDLVGPAPGPAAPVTPAVSELPLVGRIAAGQPVEAIEHQETISLSDITRAREVYVLEVRGQSMIEEHILDGDYVLVEKAEKAENGQIAVALVDEAEATLKRFYHEAGGLVRLQPANATMEPIILPAHRVRVQGRVIGILRKY